MSGKHQKPGPSIPPASPPPTSEVRTVSFVSLGCPKNLVDSEKMLGLLAEEGLAVVSHVAETMNEDPHVDAEAAVAAGGAVGGSGSYGAAEGEVVPGATPMRTRGGRGGGVHMNAGGEHGPGGAGGAGLADAVVVNTCGFLEASKEESLGVIKEALAEKAAGRVKRVVVAGCLVQRHRAKLLEWAPGIDALIGVFDRDKIVEAVKGVAPERDTLASASDKPSYWVSGNALTAAKDRGLKTVGLTVAGKDGKGIGYYEDDRARLRLTPRHYAYLRISEGCNQNCAFCTIPSIRGKMRSKPIDRIAAEAKELIADGVFELNLIGQDTTSFGDDIGYGASTGGGLVKMLEATSAAFDEAGIEGWVRLMYAYPSNFTDEMIEALARLSAMGDGSGKRAGGHILPYIDIPLQHASDRMLTLMRRNVSAGHQRELMLKLRERVPGMAIRTTFISGFPGETEADHEQLLEFVEEVGFDAVGVFEYSHEEGTVAGTMEEDPALAVPRDVKARRRGEVMALQQRIAFEQAAYLAEQFDAKQPEKTAVRFDVLVDRKLDDSRPAAPMMAGLRGTGIYAGRAYFQAPQIDSMTYVYSKRAISPGELVRCTVVGSDGYDLVARPSDELEKRHTLNVLKA